MQAKVFIAYSRADVDFLNELRKQFLPWEKANLIKVWYDGEIQPGIKWEHSIKSEMEAADIILLLVSPDSIASEYFYNKELLNAIELGEKGNKHVIPVILRPCRWEITPLGKLQALPTDGKPINLWENKDQAYYDVVTKIEVLIEDIVANRKLQLAEGGDKVTVGKLVFLDQNSNKIEYNGEVFLGKANGNGVGKVINSSHNYYEYRGKYVNNKKHDTNALLVWSNGDRYAGGFVDDQMHGQGKLTFSNGGYYQGEFHKGMRTGQGEQVINGIKYEGEFSNSLYHGKGAICGVNQIANYFKDCPSTNMEITYNGDFWEEKMDGYGILKTSWFEYEGKFLNNYPHDEKGILRFKGIDGVYHVSIFNGSIKEGHYVFSNGDSFFGQYFGEVKREYGINFFVFSGTYESPSTGYKFEGEFYLKENTLKFFALDGSAVIGSWVVNVNRWSKKFSKEGYDKFLCDASYTNYPDLNSFKLAGVSASNNFFNKLFIDPEQWKYVGFFINIPIPDTFYIEKDSSYNPTEPKSFWNIFFRKKNK